MNHKLTSALAAGAALWFGTPQTSYSQAEHASGYVQVGQIAAGYSSVRSQWAEIRALKRVIAIDLDRVTVGAALGQIAKRAELRLTYSEDIVPAKLRVTLRAHRITAAEALLRVLRGTELDILVSPEGDAVVVQRTSRLENQ